MQYYRPDDEVVPGHFLVRFLGRGGFGEVWKATGSGGVELAIKIINLGSDQGFKEFRAVRLLRKLRHPNLVPLFGFWLKDDRGFLIGDNAADSPTRIAGAAAEMVIAMGLCEKSLLDRLKECKKAGVKGIPTVELLDYMEDAGRAIDYLNEPCHDLGQGPVGIQHCDIKPANLLIVGNAAQVCDFGLARVLGDQARSSTAGAMSPAYVAPEMLDNKPCRQTDQYSLAITYYELRTGEWPFSGSDPTAAMRAHQSGNLDFSAVPMAEQRVMKRAASLDPGQRYPSTVEMVQELRRAATEIRPPSRGDIYIGGPVQPNQELVPGHKLVRKIGQGGYGEVWEGVAPGGIRCAFKIITNLDASQNVQEFRVLEMMKGLEHDHLMALQAYWLLDGEGKVLPEAPEAEPSRPARPAGAGAPGAPGASSATMLVIQTQLAAKNLAQRLKECQAIGWPGIPPHELLPYIRQAASAIDYLNAPQHHLGERILSIQHRDIKPENILLSRQGSVKVTDFGLAKMVEGTSATIHSKSRGLTAAYAAPEMFKGLVTRSTDQYSLAITYYRLRTGKLPFDQNQPLFSMMLVHTEGRLDFGLLSLAEQEVLQRATKVSPDDRFPNCLDMMAALEAALGVRSENTTASVLVTTSGPPSSLVSEPTRVVPSVPFSGDKGLPTAVPSTSARTAPPPAPAGAPGAPAPAGRAGRAGRADVPPTLPPTQHPLAARPTPTANRPLKTGAPGHLPPSPAAGGGQGGGPHVPPTLPPTQRSDGRLACRGGDARTAAGEPPVATPPPAPPPPVDEQGLGKPTQLVPVGESDFSSSAELPGPTRGTNVTVTRIKEPKPKASSTTPPDVEEEGLDPHLIDTFLPSRDMSAKPDEVLEASKEEEKVVAVRSCRPWRLAEIVAGSLLAMILGYLVVYLLWFRSPPDSSGDPGQTLELIATRIREKAFEEALRELDGATLDEKTKNREQAKVVQAWLDDLGPKDARSQVEGLRTLRNYVKDHEEANQRYRDVLARYLPARAEELSKAGDFAGALDLLKTFEPEGQPKVVLETIALTENRVLSAWVARARKHRADKDFNKANKVLTTILRKRQGQVEAVAVQKEVANDIVEVSRERGRLIEAGKFPDALKYVADAWHDSGKELSTPIFDGWLAWAEARKVSNPAAAEAALDGLLSRDPGNSRAESLRTQVRKQLVTLAIMTLIAENKTASCRDAARKLYGPDGKKLEDDERDQLGEQIAKAWLDLINKEKNPQLRKGLLIALTNEVPDSIPSSKTAKKLIGEIPDIEADRVVRDAVQDLLRGRFSASRTELQKVRRQVGASDKDLVARVDVLLPLVDLAERATADPLKGDLEGLEKALDDSRLTEGDRSNLKGLSGRLFDRRIRLRVAALPKDVNWSQLLADCKKVEEDPSAWVLACRVECLEALRRTDEKEWDTACRELRQCRVEPEAAAYATYALTLADWWTKDAREAAQRLVRLLGDREELPPVLGRVPFRRNKAQTLFLGAITPLQVGATFTQPFTDAAGASEAYHLLKVARRLAGEAAGASLQANLALAAWYKMPRHIDLAKDLTSDLAKDRGALLKALPEPDVYRILVIHAATRGTAAAERKAALDSYLAILEMVRAMVRKKKEPQIAEHFYNEVIKSIANSGGATLLGEKPGDDLKDRFAQLCSGVARLLKDSGVAWARLAKADGGPLPLAKRFYDLAYQNATDKKARAEYLVLKGFVAYQLPNPKWEELKRWAEEARRLDPDYAGSYGLAGAALVQESRGKKDLQKQKDDLLEADRRLKRALELRDKLNGDRKRDLSALLPLTRGILLLELANYLPKRADQEEVLRDAKTWAEEALKEDDGNPDAWTTYGFILEDFASLLGKTDQFEKACGAFRNGMERSSVESGQTRPWLGLGRTRLKWALSRYTRKGLDPEARKLLDDARSDLNEVVTWSSDPVEVAEAHFQQARIAMLQNKPAAAKAAFEAGWKKAQNQSAVWEEAILEDWANLVCREVLERRQAVGFDLNKGIEEAKQRCSALEQFSKAKAAKALVEVVVLETSRDSAKSSDLASLFKRGLEKGRTQDEPVQAYLLARRAHLYLRGVELDYDANKAYDDAIESLRLAAKGSVDDSTQGWALGSAGIVRQVQAPKAGNKKEEYTEEATERLRKAVSLAPRHFAAWEWKARLAYLLTQALDEDVKSGTQQIKKDATLAAEACRNYLEADQDLPANERDRFSWVGRVVRGTLKTKALPKLRKALETSSNDPEEWQWHLSIAALLASEEEADDKEAARTSLQQARRGAPATAENKERFDKLEDKIRQKP